MVISGYEVTNLTNKSAQVGCAVVTREEVEALLYAMDKAPAPSVRYRIQCQYLTGSWGNCTSDALGGEYSLAEAYKRIEEAPIRFGRNWSFRVVPV